MNPTFVPDEDDLALRSRVEDDRGREFEVAQRDVVAAMVETPVIDLEALVDEWGET